MLKNLQVRPQEHTDWELHICKLNLEMAEESEVKLPTLTGAYEKQEDSKIKDLLHWLCESLKVNNNKLQKILKENFFWEIFLRNLYAGQETTARTGHGTTDWFQIGKGVRQACILLPCLFNFYTEYNMQNAWLDEAQAGIKIAGRNINNLRDAGDFTLMGESEELKSLLMKAKEESVKAGFKLNIQINKIMAFGPITSYK